MDDSRPPGQIITFYSYKGGTGRSMALANVGYLLAGRTAPRGRGVLLIDWDLEAPGLHRYFEERSGGGRTWLPTRSAEKPAGIPGLIDFL